MLETIVGTVFVLGSSFFLILMASLLRSGLSSRAWPTIEGEVVESRVEEEFDEGYLCYKPIVRYRYWISDQEYTSEGLSYQVYSPDQGTVEEMVGRYPVGSRVQVHYDPRHPKHAVLEPGAPGKTLKLILATVALLVVMLTLGLALLLGFLTQAGE